MSKLFTGNNPRILITNDDGIRAPGLKVLRAIAESISDDVWVVAPAEEQSGMSRALSLNSPLRARRVADKRYAVTGTPADCVLMAINDIVEGKEPDLVLSGVNRGQNIAEDVTVSGTVAGAMQGRQMGIPSIAFSQAYGFSGRDTIKWQTASAFGPVILKKLLEERWSENVVMNVNFPDREPEDVAEIEVTVQGTRDQHNIKTVRREDLRGQAYYWIGFEGRPSTPAVGTDLRAIYEGRISITPLHLDLTHHETRDRLADHLSGPVEAPVES
ncbi:stationary phase survival protein SurE [Glycocaulis alkaliphilus]|uniref:5'-nucleotidase SurE n=1 Tax=Glycocaulis alkaliphilus TaxID=1434191 RepID=A0A3T0E9M2_9PROT|nr:5'/3'-nucleotidase SurE [Glycocaulis alkaliphilus]AZU03972.1 stationary phase survival protein SurE [Glycocaulis alkaliphilus]GGB74772.1 5'-nucleotidase SurE [Glycocaulis alkaliphilus]